MLPEIDIASDVAVSPNLTRGSADVACAFPSPCRLQSGGLVCVYRQGSDKHSPDGVLVAQHSTDDGRSWSPPVTVFGGLARPNAESVHAGIVCERADGTVQAYFKAIAVTESAAFIFSEEGRQLPQQLYIAESRDDGATWGEAAPRILPHVPRDHYIGTRPMLLACGEWLLAIEATVDGNEIALVSTSPDGGQSWRPAWECAADPRLSFGDPRLTRLADGRILMFLWTWVTQTEETMPVHCCLSGDEGRAWSPPTSTGIPAQLTSPFAVENGMVLAVGNVRKGQQGIRLWASRDAERWDGGSSIELWSAHEERITGKRLTAAGAITGEPDRIWDNLPSFSFGTPDIVPLGAVPVNTVPLGGGQLLMTYYATIGGILHVRACRFGVRW